MCFISVLVGSVWGCPYFQHTLIHGNIHVNFICIMYHHPLFFLHTYVYSFGILLEEA